MAHTDEGLPPDLDRAEVEAARESLREGLAVRMLLGGSRRVVLCTSIEDVVAAQRGRIPPDAVRLDRGRIG